MQDRIYNLTGKVSQLLSQIDLIGLAPSPPHEDLLPIPDKTGVIFNLKKTSESKEAKPESDFTFFVVGCADNGVSQQHKVAALMDQVATQEHKPDFIVMLGDNFSKHGVDQVNADIFKTNFHQVYQNRELKTLNQIPWFNILGNHDEDVGSANADLEKAARQIQHSFIDHRIGTIDAEKLKTFENKDLNLADLYQNNNLWNMPGRFYGLILNQVEMYFIDSNTYAREFINAFIKFNDDKPTNQARWLQTVAKNDGKPKFLFLHHSLHTIGKRTLRSDAFDYLTPEEIELLKLNNIIASEKTSFNRMLNNILLTQDLSFTTVFAAHDHSMYYFNDQICQVVAGGGGGGLQSRYDFSRPENVPGFIRDHGFVKVSVNTTPRFSATFDFHSISGHHLKFHHSQKLAIQSKNLEDEFSAKLRDLVIKTCNDFQKSYLANNPPVPWAPPSLFFPRVIWDDVPNDVYYSDVLKNYFNHASASKFTPDLLLEALNFSKPSQNLTTLRGFFEKHLTILGIDYAEFIKNPEIICAVRNNTPERLSSTPIPIPVRTLNLEEKESSFSPASFKVTLFNPTSLGRNINEFYQPSERSVSEPAPNSAPSL